MYEELIDVLKASRALLVRHPGLSDLECTVLCQAIDEQLAWLVSMETPTPRRDGPTTPGVRKAS